MTPADYLNEVVLPAAHELRANPRSRGRAYLACIAAFHVKDHLKQAGAPGIEPSMRAATGYMFDVVRGVCNGTKHVQTDGKHVVAFSAGEDTDRPPAIFGEMILDSSIFGDTVGGRDVSTPGGVVDVYDAVAAVLKAYVDQFPQQLGDCDVSDL